MPTDVGNKTTYNLLNLFSEFLFGMLFFLYDLLNQDNMYCKTHVFQPGPSALPNMPETEFKENCLKYFIPSYTILINQNTHKKFTNHQQALVLD